MKTSKLQRKLVNQMRGMADVPWPARRFRYPPTFGTAQVVGRCSKLVGEVAVRRPGWRGRLRGKRPVAVVCGGDVVLVPYRGLRCQLCVSRRRYRHRLTETSLEQMVRDADRRGLVRKLLKRSQA